VTGALRMRRVAFATVLLATSLAIVAPSPATSAPVFWKNYRQPVKVEPTRINVNYSTGFAWVTRLNGWEGWGGARATSRGVAHLNTCKPYCAAGNYKAYRTRVTLYKIRRCGRQRRPPYASAG